MSIRLGVLGCGFIANHSHGPAIAEYVRTHSDIECVACCDVRQESAETFAKQYGFAKAETDVARFLADYQLDAVYLFASESVSAELACRVARANIPFMLEKPPGKTTAETDAIIAACQGRDLLVHVAFNRRYMPLVLRLRDEIRPLLAQCPIQHIQYEMIRSNRQDADFSTTAIHGIDLVRHVAGAQYAKADFSYQLIDSAKAHVNYFISAQMTGGAHAALAFCPMAGGNSERMSVFLAGHSFYLELPVGSSVDGPGRLRHVVDRQVVLDISSAPEELPSYREGFYHEGAAFLDAMRAGQKGVSDLADSRQSVEVTEMIRARKVNFFRG